MNRAERILAILLRVTGAAAACALFAVFLPTPWMAAIHRWVGLGAFPEGRIVEYLARSLSLFYALFGGLLLWLARDPRRHADVIRWIGVAGIVFGLFVLGIDLSVGMPLHWTLQEGPFVFAWGVAILLLESKARRAAG